MSSVPFSPHRCLAAVPSPKLGGQKNICRERLSQFSAQTPTNCCVQLRPLHFFHDSPSRCWPGSQVPIPSDESPFPKPGQKELKQEAAVMCKCWKAQAWAEKQSSTSALISDLSRAVVSFRRLKCNLLKMFFVSLLKENKGSQLQQSTRTVPTAPGRRFLWSPIHPLSTTPCTLK